ETASRLRGRIEAVLAWATVSGHRGGDNPARWRGHMDKLLPAKTKVAKVKHFMAMPYADLPEFMAELSKGRSISARALEFTILTAARTGEVIGSRWSEIDFDKRLWIVSGERTKSGREHRVPLPDRALDILKAIPREGEFVFPGSRAKHPLSSMPMLEMLRGMRSSLTVHGFRSTFRDWCGDRTNYPREMIEFALAHAIGNKTEAAYRRATALEKRRNLMQAWAKFCTSPTWTGCGSAWVNYKAEVYR
ncbi:MAG: tyrosine-type recombinase/integrase, partial [Candidatus Marinimicrobia bacterium]|nr:tyrosine-type recombinase/integrase [Candidatus Neomarinimicrobiota bacterium]